MEASNSSWYCQHDPVVFNELQNCTLCVYQGRFIVLKSRWLSMYECTLLITSLGHAQCLFPATPYGISWSTRANAADWRSEWLKESTSFSELSHWWDSVHLNKLFFFYISGVYRVEVKVVAWSPNSMTMRVQQTLPLHWQGGYRCNLKIWSNLRSVHQVPITAGWTNTVCNK